MPMFTKKINIDMLGGKCFPVEHISLKKVGKFGIPHFHVLVTDSYET